MSAATSIEASGSKTTHGAEKRQQRPHNERLSEAERTRKGREEERREESRKKEVDRSTQGSGRSHKHQRTLALSVRRCIRSYVLRTR